MKALTVVGARPQFIKASSVSSAIERFNRSAGQEVIEEILVHTGQHYDHEMSNVFFEELNIKRPKYNLSVGSGTHGSQTGAMLKRLEKVVIIENPDIVLVYGDTNSTLAGALTAAKLRIPIVHVEAGLRSYNKKMSEEVNRVLTDHMSTWLFCPTETAVENLRREGIIHGVHLVGDVMYDLLLSNLQYVNEKSKILDQYDLNSGEYLLATIHRAENVDNLQNLASIIKALKAIDEIIVFPVHPRTRKALYALEEQPNSHIRMIDPVSYLDFLVLEKNSRLVLTDSGGVQKEAYILGVPCITLREETEWVETVESGWNRTVGIDPVKVIESISTFCPNAFRPPLYGDGRSSERIIKVLSELKY